MSEDVPQSDADDVLRTIRAGRGASRPDEHAAPAGTFLLTSVHRVGGADEDAPRPEATSAASPSAPGEVVPLEGRHGRRPGHDGRRDWGLGLPKPWEGPGRPSRATLGEMPPAPEPGRPAAAAALRPAGERSVPGLEDPSDGDRARPDTDRPQRAGADGAAPEPLASDPRSGAPGARPLDEDAVRRIVEEVLDARLQGETGQRITRNLRALVRREVMRLFAERDRG